MSDKTNERLEREALESLVAADLSAKMKQWREPTPPSGGGGNKGGSAFRLLIMLLIFGGAAWWLWPNGGGKQPVTPVTPMEQPAPAIPPSSAPVAPEKQLPAPMAQKPAGNQRYLALAQSNYHAPNFAADIRGDAPAGQNALNDARQAMANQRPAEALDALQQIPSEYQTDADYLRAHALFRLKKYNQAARIFHSLNGSIRYGEAAEWYEILAMLSGGQDEKATIVNRLKKIAGDDGHTFQREARQLLGQI